MIKAYYAFCMAAKGKICVDNRRTLLCRILFKIRGCIWVTQLSYQLFKICGRDICHIIY